MPIKIAFEADSADQLRVLMAEFASFAQGNAMPLTDVEQTPVRPEAATVTVATEPKPEPEPQKRKRGRPKKNPDPEPEPKGKPEDYTVNEDDAIIDGASGDEASGSRGSLAPKEARERAIKEAQTFFAQNPGRLSELSALQRKYGVKLFAEVADDRANELLADVLLLASGSTQTNTKG